MIIVLHLHREKRPFEDNITQKIKKVFEHAAKQIKTAVVYQNSKQIKKWQISLK
mgnify:FL=1